ncbi:MAG: hypothetical protein IPL41_16035 [Micropruina sp.]|nr:hypothetical protein [Micropruina sp.]
MSEVLTGKGPQPPSVYWVRRGLVALAAVVIIGLLVWAFVPKNQPTTATPAGTATPTAIGTQSAPVPSPTATASEGGATPTSTAPTVCDPIGVQLSVEGFKSVKADAKQVFSVTVENNTAMPCVMQINKDTFRLRVASGADLIWSTGHCAEWLPEVKQQTLKAGGTVEFKVNWGLHRSADGCKQAKSLLGAGTYVATALYRDTSTGRFTFTIAK